MQPYMSKEIMTTKCKYLQQNPYQIRPKRKHDLPRILVPHVKLFFSGIDSPPPKPSPIFELGLGYNRR